MAECKCLLGQKTRGLKHGCIVPSAYTSVERVLYMQIPNLSQKSFPVFVFNGLAVFDQSPPTWKIYSDLIHFSSRCLPLVTFICINSWLPAITITIPHKERHDNTIRRF